MRVLWVALFLTTAGAIAWFGTGSSPRSGDVVPQRVVPPVASRRPQFHAVDHHPDATPDERQRIDELIELAIFANAGRDSRDAQKALTAFGLKAVPRLVNAFHRVHLREGSGEGFDSLLGRLEAGFADRVLRSIDGFQDRVRPTSPIIPQHEKRYAEKVALAWVAWWDEDGWKHPEKPWDPKVDGERRR